MQQFNQQHIFKIFLNFLWSTFINRWLGWQTDLWKAEKWNVGQTDDREEKRNSVLQGSQRRSNIAGCRNFRVGTTDNDPIIRKFRNRFSQTDRWQVNVERDLKRQTFFLCKIIFWIFEFQFCQNCRCRRWIGRTEFRNCTSGFPERPQRPFTDILASILIVGFFRFRSFYKTILKEHVRKRNSGLTIFLY